MARGKSYSRKERERILEEMFRSGLSVLEFSRKVGIPASTLHTWGRKAKQVGARETS